MTRDAADIGQEIVDNHLSMRPYPRWSSLVSAIAAAIEKDRAEREAVVEAALRDEARRRIAALRARNAS